MPLLQDLIKVGSQVEQSAKPTLAEVVDVIAGVVQALEAAGIGAPSGAAATAPPTALSEREQKIVDLQNQVAEISGSERAAVDPAAVATEVAQLHEEIGQLQSEGDPPAPASAPAPAPVPAEAPAAVDPSEREKELEDQIASLQVQLADAQRAQVTVEHSDVPEPGAPA